MSNELTKTSPSNALGQPKKLGGLTGVHARMQARQASSVDPNTMPNRIVLMLDCSGSMSSPEQQSGRSKMDHLIDACQHFVASCNFGDTTIGVETFGLHDETHMPFSCDSGLLTITIMGLQATGGTPMGAAMESTLGMHSLTRGIIVSDGSATDMPRPIEQAKQFAEAGVPVDTVHIGRNQDGEETLKQIAEITGGLYIKFDNIQNFAKNFKFLAPAFRAMLTSGGSGVAEQMGAKEIK